MCGKINSFMHAQAEELMHGRFFMEMPLCICSYYIHITGNYILFELRDGRSGIPPLLT